MRRIIEAVDEEASGMACLGKKRDTSRFQKIAKNGTLGDLRNHFVKIVDGFVKHVYTKRSQAATFEEDNEEVKKSEGKVALLQIDFAESYTCLAQDEVQSAHWNQATV